MESEHQIIQIIASTFAVDAALISLTTTQNDVKGWDSLGQLRLVMRLEAEFGISFSIDEIPSLNSVEKILMSIQSRKTGL